MNNIQHSQVSGSKKTPKNTSLSSGRWFIFIGCLSASGSVHTQIKGSFHRSHDSSSQNDPYECCLLSDDVIQ